MDGGAMDVDRMWHTFKTICNRLRSATAVKERAASVAEAEAFMADPRHRARVHKWRAWGLLFSGLINAVRSDICACMGIDPGAGASAIGGRKRKIKGSTSTKSRTPKLTWWLNLRNEFANSHVLDGPMLHLDPNGRDCVAEFFNFALLVINRGDSNESDPAARRMLGEIERAAWQTIELIAGYRVYCAVVEKKQLQEAIELALAAIDHGAVPHNAFPSAGSSDFTLLASCIHVVLQHAPYDLHDWLPMLVPFLSSWFATLNEKIATRSPHADVAPKMIEIVTDLGRTFFTFIGPLLLKHGNPMLQYVKRSFKQARLRSRVLLADFVSLYVELFEYHADSLQLQGDLEPRRLRRDAKALQSIFLDPVLLQSVPVSSHTAASSMGIGIAASGGNHEAPTVSLEPSSVALFACAADVVFFHDRLLQRVLEISKAQDISSIDQEEDTGMMESPSSAKRSLESTMPMAWEQLIHRIVSSEHNEESSLSANASAPLSQLREQLAHQTQHQKQARLLQRRHVADMLVLSALLRRHGNFYAEGRIGDLVGIMDHITQTLESKDIGKRQYLALHLLFQLAMLSPSHPDLRSELFEDYWRKAWSTLLRPDFPYVSELRVAVPRHGLGELAFTALHCCVGFRLVSRSEIASANAQLWAIYRPRSSTTPSHGLSSSPISAAPIGFLSSLLQLIHPPSDSELRKTQLAPHQDLSTRSIRSEVLSAVFEHIQSAVLVEESKPMDSSWENHFSPHDAIPAMYAAGLLSFLGIPPPPRLVNSFLCLEMEPILLRALSTSSLHKKDAVVGPELDGFGVHFALQEWGIAWLQDTSSCVDNGKGGHPDRYTALLEFVRQSQENNQRAKDTKADWVKAIGFDHLRIPDSLARRSTRDSPYQLTSTVSFLAEIASLDGDMAATASVESVEASKSAIVTNFTEIVDDLSNKMSAVEQDSPRLLCHLNSIMTVALTLASAFGQAKDTASLDSRHENTGAQGIMCSLLQKTLGVLACHLSAGTVDHARKTAMTASIVTQQLMDFQSLILLVQGGNSLQILNHPCADPIDLRIPSELRPSIRKTVAAIEASLELMLMDSGSGGFSNSHSKATQSRDEPALMSSRSFSSATASSTPTPGTSWDWDAHLSQSRTATRVVFSATAEVEEDELLSESVTLTSKPTYRATHATKILSLWSLRVILLLKKESGLKTVRKYALELDFTPDFLIAVASLLCGVCGCESLEVLVKIMDAVDKDVAEGIRRGGASGNPSAALLLDTDILLVLKRCAMMHEGRKLLHKEDIPELLLTTARRLIDAGRQEAASDQLLVLRRAVVATMEVFFRLNADLFGDFIDVTMVSLLDPAMAVRLESVRTLQTLFYMYPDGGEQVFRDLFQVLSQCLPPSASSPSTIRGTTGESRSSSVESGVVALSTLYVCACSSPTVVPEALLVVMRLATAKDVAFYARSSILTDWLDEISVWYGYPSVGRMVADHFCFLWSNHLMVAAGGGSLLETDVQRKFTEKLEAKELLEAFPATLMLESSIGRLAASSARMFASHVDVILPLAVVYDIAHGGGGSEGPSFSLVEDLARHLLLCSSPARDIAEDVARQRHLSGFVQEQLITDLFALAFVLESASTCTAMDGAPVLERVGAHMLTVAEERASTYALTLSHLGHVVVKMVRFSVLDIVGSIHPPALETSTVSSAGERWLQAMKIMKEKYSGFDWGRMNLAEILSEFHEVLLHTAYFEPLASRAIECLCLFVVEIKESISDKDTANNAVLQHLLLHVLFETAKNVKRRDKSSSRKLAFTVRDICDHFMKNCTETFGKYIDFVVQGIADILVCASRASDAVPLDSDDKANFEWVVFAICNNMATGLGKFMVDVELVPAGVSACLDKLNSMLSISPGKSARESSTERRKSLETANRKLTKAITDKACQQAIQEIEKFVLRANQVSERFHQPRTFALGNGTSMERSGIQHNDVVGIGSQLHVLCDHVRVLHEALQANERDEMTDEDKIEAAATQKEVMAKLARTLFTLSTQYDYGSAYPNDGDVLLTLADTLGRIGMGETNDFELSPGQNGEELSRLYQRHFRRGALRETKTTFQMDMYEHTLRYLSSLLFEVSGDAFVSSEVIHEALNSIKKVLRLDEGVNALTKCKDQELKFFLDAFVHTSPSNWSLGWSSAAVIGAGCHPSVASLSKLRVLWRAHNTSSFQEWIGALTEALAESCVDRVLQACAPLARLRADLAIFMLPYVLWAILKNARRDSKTAAVVNECIREIICASGNTVPDGRVVQLLIHSINFLRETEKALFVETNGQKLSGATTTPTKKGTSNAVSAPTSQSSDTSKRERTGGNSSVNRLAYSCLVGVDLLELAEAAIRVKMPFSAMQYVEMWLEDHHGGLLSSLSASSVAVSASLEWDARVRKILVDAYNLDDDADGIYGVNDGRTLGSQMVAYNREGNFAQVLPLYDVALQFDRSASNIRVVEESLNALNHLGYEHMLLQRLEALAGRGTNTPNIQEHRFELAWKSLQWDSLEIDASHVTLPGAARLDGNQSPYMHQRTIYQALKALAHRDIGQLKHITALAKQHILTNARTSLFGLECTQESIEALLHLQTVHEIEECAKTADTAALTRLFETWQKRHCMQSKSVFDATYGLLALEEVLAQLVDLPERTNTLAGIYLSISTQGREAGRVAVAYKAHTKLEQLHKLGQLRLLDEARWKMERAKLLWSQRETRSAIWVAKHLQADLEAKFERQRGEETDTHLRMLYVASLTMTGKWIASQRSENSQVILREYLQKATDIVDTMSGSELHTTPSDAQHAARAHTALAEYMAEMYQQVAARVSSREWLAGKRVAEARQRELDECLAMSEAKQHDNRAHIHALNKEVQYDYEERTKVEASVEHFLGGALRSFGKALMLSAKSELAVVFRVLSLWFSNHLKPSVNRVVREIVDSVPSYKFVPLSYQIISRVGSSLSSTGSSTLTDGVDSDALFERVLSAMVIKLCEQHPHHALVQLIALKNSGDVEGKGSVEFRTNVGDAKSEGAKRYIEKLRKGPQCDLLESLDMVSNAYIQLALFDTRDYHKLGKKIALAEIKITTLGGNAIPFDQCLRDRSRRSGSSSSRAAMPAVLTSWIAPRPDLDYSEVSRMLSFDPMFSITDSGIHRPKIIYCFGSDGRRFKQLVKGKDDIRQDLVIEQVFDTVNQFLQDDQSTRKRNLRLRTYKVVPLSPIAGVLEWVDRTIPWGSYLVSRVAKRLSAHERYHPHEWKHAECRMYLKNQPDKFAAFETIQANFTPVFHHFFLEKFPDASMWYKRRLAFVQSAAVTSIVGYILGIGDRHSQNILIHEDTAELVHIDFGVVFDQGMALFTPETVPFRLTRDLVDGMGVTGVDGVFTRCCEATLQLLRRKSASVVTILEVVVHDPLYRWTLSPLKALKIQEEGGTRPGGSSAQDTNTGDGVAGATNNDAASRALLRVKQKLEGYEDPNGNALSIEGQVKQLISAAQDPRNLCALFPGWAPWL